MGVPPPQGVYATASLKLLRGKVSPILSLT